MEVLAEASVMMLIENSAADTATAVNSALVNSAAAEISQRKESNTQSPPLSQKKKRTKDPGIRVKGARIYDSANGKTCHQCRQKTRDFVVFCKNLKNEKPCPLTFCYKCLLNRYGEKAEEVGKLEVWICPKCRGDCNCSFCMKRKGYQPTGILAHRAKARGFNSVHEFLHDKGAEILEPRTVESTASPEKSRLSNKDFPASKRSRDEDQDAEQAEAGANEPLRKVRKSRKLALRAHSESCREDIVLPAGSPLIEVAGAELPAQDAGAALQFLEFCNSFSEVLDINKGQPECILQDLSRGRVERHGVCSGHMEFNIKLLSLIEKDMKKEGDEWVHTLKRCIEESECTSRELPMDFLDSGLSGYDNLEPSEKLKILNFLCDEVLGTEKLRNWIDEVAAKFEEGRKENKEKFLAAKKKEKDLKQKVNATVKAMRSAEGGTSLSLVEPDDLFQLRIEADKAHTEVLSSLELVPKKNQRIDAVRTDHVILGSNGQRFWKLSGYKSRSNIILQDIGTWNSVPTQDKWFIYNEEEEKVVEKYISSLRNPALRRNRSVDAEEGTKCDLSDSPGSKDFLPELPQASCTS